MFSELLQLYTTLSNSPCMSPINNASQVSYIQQLPSETENTEDEIFLSDDLSDSTIDITEIPTENQKSSPPEPINWSEFLVDLSDSSEESMKENQTIAEIAPPPPLTEEILIKEDMNTNLAESVPETAALAHIHFSEKNTNTNLIDSTIDITEAFSENLQPTSSETFNWDEILTNSSQSSAESPQLIHSETSPEIINGEISGDDLINSMINTIKATELSAIKLPPILPQKTNTNDNFIDTTKESTKNHLGAYPWEIVKPYDGNIYYVYKNYFRLEGKISTDVKTYNYFHKLGCKNPGASRHLINPIDDRKIIYFNIEKILSAISEKIDKAKETNAYLKTWMQYRQAVLEIQKKSLEFQQLLLINHQLKETMETEALKIPESFRRYNITRKTRNSRNPYS